MKIEINPGDRQLAFILVFTAVVLAVGIAGAYTANSSSDPTGNQPALMGHSADEVDLRPLHIDAANSRVGIGTTTPGAKLEIAGSTPRDFFRMNDTTSGNWYGFRIITGGDLALNYNDGTYHYPIRIQKPTGNDAIIIQSDMDVILATTSGNVGIGTTTPSEELDVTGDIIASGTICDSGGSNCIGGGGSSLWEESGTNIYNANTGNVGIGTTSPSQKLEVNGNLKLSTANPYIYSGGSYIVIPNGLYVSGGTTYIKGSLRPRGGIYNDAASYLTISGGTSGNTYFPGNVGIGTTSPSSKLHVVGGSINASGGLIIETRTSDPASPATGQMWLRTDI